MFEVFNNSQLQTDNPYDVTGGRLGEACCPIIDIVISLEVTKERNINGAVRGTLKVYHTTEKDIEYGLRGKLVGEYPVVSGSKNDAPTPEGIYINLKQEKTSTSTNETLYDSHHGGPDNIMIRLPNTGGDAIHQGLDSSTIDRAFTQGCTAITGNTGGTVTGNYESFKNDINPYGYSDVGIHSVEVIHE